MRLLYKAVFCLVVFCISVFFIACGKPSNIEDVVAKNKAEQSSGEQMTMVERKAAKVLARHQTHSKSVAIDMTHSRIKYNGKRVYLSGINLAWFDFAKDLSSGVSKEDLARVFLSVTRNGGNSLRWWMHTDGSFTPEWGDVNGVKMIVGPGADSINNFNKALDLAAEYNVYLIPSLWSFDMLKKNAYRKPPNADNYRLLMDDDVLQSYIDNSLIPMVKALNDHPQLFAWELMNEPENMTESWFLKIPEFYGGKVPSLQRLQRVQALMAAAIHKTALDMGQTALVTTGSKSLGKYNSDAVGNVNLYRDDRMQAAAGNDRLATLDFYAPHYYNNENRMGAWSPFHHPASYWKVNKPIVIAELYVEGVDVLSEPIKGEDLCEKVHALGYAGSWSWQWTEDNDKQQKCLQVLHGVKH